jgi:hypothetical protein
MDNGCIAVWRIASGPRKVAGPITKGRPEVKGWKCARLSYHLNVAPLPKTPATLKEGIVCHHCDNAWCINPYHLYLGTAKQNTSDIWKRNKCVRERMSEARKGNSNAKGKKWSQDKRDKLSISLVGNANAKGHKHKRTQEQIERYKNSWTQERKAKARSRLAGNTYRRDHLAARKNNTEQA